MDPKQFYRRLCAVVVLLGLILTGMGSALYDLQINKPLVSSESYPTSNSNYGISLRFSLAQ